MFKTVKGLVLRRKKFGEAHAYITIITAEGLVTFGAYGIMSPKNRNFASCQPYTLSEFVLTAKGETLTLSQASTVSHLVKSGVDFEGLSLVNYIVSMAAETSFTDEDAESIYSLTCTALYLIDSNSIPREIIKAVFELRLTASLGFYPDLSACISCGKETDGGLFVPYEGGIICAECNLDESVQGVTVTGGLAKALEHMQTLPEKKAFTIRFEDPVVQNSFCTLAERYSSEHLDCAASALAFYKNNLKNF
ncbi:MAG: DNA repair protein RecO [Ruminococcaceae bacterium]|nr:DNA repair protein RecO [Oscillospiraceae bacterium]